MLRTKVKRRIFKKIKERIQLQSFNSYFGVLSHADSHKLEEKLRPIYDFIEFAEPALISLLEESQDWHELKLPERVGRLEKTVYRQ